MANKLRQPEIAVIGLGRFGASVALTLARQGFSVVGVDRDPKLVQSLADDLTQTLSFDATDESALRAVDIASFDTVIVAIGVDFEANPSSSRGVACAAEGGAEGPWTVGASPGGGGSRRSSGRSSSSPFLP